MPAEWHPHSATLLHWPSNRSTWPGERLERIEDLFLEIIGHLHRFEPVLLLAEPSVIARVEQCLGERDLDQSRIVLADHPVNDIWTRDCGPLFIHKRGSGGDTYALTDWRYNAWGGKYPPWDGDDAVPEMIAGRYGVPRYGVDLVLEGGAIETNGEGLFVTTESVLLNPNRNPGYTRTGIEKALRDYLGAEEVIWLGDGLAGDDTDGHIDDLCRFLNEETLVTVRASDPDQVNYHVLEENYRRLRRVAEEREGGLNLEVLPLPETRIDGVTVDGSEHVPASYANFYIANGAVLVPLYDERYDDQALDLIGRYFPNREVIGIRCADLVWGQGGIHCVTQPLYGIGEL